MSPLLHVLSRTHWPGLKSTTSMLHFHSTPFKAIFMFRLYLNNVRYLQLMVFAALSQTSACFRKWFGPCGIAYSSILNGRRTALICTNGWLQPPSCLVRLGAAESPFKHKHTCTHSYTLGAHAASLQTTQRERVHQRPVWSNQPSSDYIEAPRFSPGILSREALVMMQEVQV